MMACALSLIFTTSQGYRKAFILIPVAYRMELQKKSSRHLPPGAFSFLRLTAISYRSLPAFQPASCTGRSVLQ
jgi:hypothetical protein